MSFIKFLVKFLFISSVSLVYAEDISGINTRELSNSIYSDFESYSIIDFLKNNDECIAYFGNINNKRKAQFLALYSKGKENFFIKSLCFQTSWNLPRF